MGIGARKPIQLIEVVKTLDADGRNVNTPQTPVDTWAEIDSPSGSRDFMNGQTTMGQTKDFLIRYDFTSQPDVHWFIRYDGKDWTIQNRIAIDEKSFYWRITAQSKGNV